MQIHRPHPLPGGDRLKFAPAPLAGAFLVDLEPLSDRRGFFARSWCAEEFRQHGLNDRLLQCNISFNRSRGTIRGMHFQAAPHEEAKLVRCTAGAIYDVIVDLRRDSETWCQWYAVELTAANRRALFIPEGFAHGFQSLEPDSEVFYQMSESYHPDSARGVRWNDSAFSIRWPIDEVIVSDRDASYPDYERSPMRQGR